MEAYKKYKDAKETADVFEKICNSLEIIIILLDGSLSFFILGSIFDYLALFLPSWMSRSGDTFGIIPYSPEQFKYETWALVGCWMMYLSPITCMIPMVMVKFGRNQAKDDVAYRKIYYLRIIITASINAILLLIVFILFVAGAPNFTTRKYEYDAGSSAYLALVTSIFYLFGILAAIYRWRRKNKKSGAVVAPPENSL